MNDKESPPPNRELLKEVTKLVGLKQHKEIIAIVEKHIVDYPSDHEALYHLGLAKLQADEVTQGLKLLYHRSYIKGFYPKQSFVPDTPVWDGTPTQDKVLIWSTPGPGVGSDVFMLSFLGGVLQKQQNLVVSCDKRLIPTLKRSFPQCTFCGYEDVDPSDVEQIKFHAPVAGLPKFYFRCVGHDTYPAQFPLLKVDESLKNRFREKYSAAKKSLVGISWYTPNLKSSNMRSPPDEVVLTLSGLRQTRLISLQHGAEKLPLWKNPAIHFDETFNPMEDMESLMHQIAAMNYIISIDNSVAYLAGALGIKTYLLLPEESNWPWEVRKKHASFYPTVEIIQKNPGETWTQVVEGLVKRINRSRGVLGWLRRLID